MASAVTIPWTLMRPFLFGAHDSSKRFTRSSGTSLFPQLWKHDAGNPLRLAFQAPLVAQSVLNGAAEHR